MNARVARPLARAVQVLLDRAIRAKHSRERHESFARAVKSLHGSDPTSPVVDAKALPSMSTALTLLQRGVSWTEGGPAVLIEALAIRSSDAMMIETLERLLRHVELRRARALDASVTGIRDAAALACERASMTRLFASATVATGDPRYLNAALKLSDYFGPSRQTAIRHVDLAWTAAYASIERAIAALEADLTACARNAAAGG